jgi:ribose transport system permease protein
MSEQATTGALEQTPVSSTGALEPPRTPDPTSGGRGGNAVLAWLSPKRIGAVYVWIAIIVVFCIWRPSSFATWQTVKTILNQNTVPGIVALALVVPLSTQVFDLSVGYVLGLGTALLAYLLASTSLPLSVCLILTVAAGVVVGFLNAVVVVPLRIDSFIGTLATGSIISAVIVLVTGDQDISGIRLTGPISKLSSGNIGGFEIPVFIMLALALLLWWLMGHTVTGRRLYATGFNEEAARLTGVPTKRLRFYALILSAVVATISGIVLMSQIQSASPDIGPPYLLDAYAAVFLGSTQIRPGRFNVWGTVIGVLLVATGQTGLDQVGAPIWAGDLFTGVVLLLALGMTNLERVEMARGWVKRRRRLTEAAADPGIPTKPAATT